MINAVGLQNPGIDGLARRACALLRRRAGARHRQHRRQPARRTTSRCCGASRSAWPPASAELPDVVGYELNVSCPNVGQGAWRSAPSPARPRPAHGGRAGAHPRLVIVKLTPNVTDVVAVARAAAESRRRRRVAGQHAAGPGARPGSASCRSSATAPAASAGRPSSRSRCAWCGRSPSALDGAPRRHGRHRERPRRARVHRLRRHRGGRRSGQLHRSRGGPAASSPSWPSRCASAAWPTSAALRGRALGDL